MREMLLTRYSLQIGDRTTAPANVIERAVDIHALRVIGSSGYQKCVSYLWRGWLVQDDDNPSQFIEYAQKTNTDYWAHFDPDRMRVPLYQNAVQIAISIIYLILYTIAINTVNPTGDLDVIEGLLYIFTAGFIFDEAGKFYKVGRYYLRFWNAFNCTLYVFLTISFVARMIALGHPTGHSQRKSLNTFSYNFLAFSAPMFWTRLLLYLDTFRFFGAMLVVINVMMKESLIFFALLAVILIGFLQGFVGLDLVDNEVTATSFILKGLANAIMASPDFDGFNAYSLPTFYYTCTVS